MGGVAVLTSTIFATEGTPGVGLMVNLGERKALASIDVGVLVVV